MDAGLGGGVIDLAILPAWPLIEPILTMRPKPRASIPSQAALHMLKQPPRLVSSTSSQPWRFIFFMVASRVIPALLTITSTGPARLRLSSPGEACVENRHIPLYDRMPVRASKALARSSLPA